MPERGDSLSEVQQGDPITAVGWNEIVRQVRSLSGYGNGQDVIATPFGTLTRTKKPPLQQSCALTHELYIDGNPTSGSQIWSYTIDSDTQDVTLQYDDTAAEVKTAFLGALSGLTTDDLTATGGPFPNVAIYITFRGGVDVEWPPVQGTTTLNNSAAMKIRKSGG